MSPYRIKRAQTAAELAAIAKLDAACFNRGVECSRLESSEAWIAVHIPTGAVIGYALGRWIPNENAYYLSRAGVHPKHRGHGLQKRLIRVRIANAHRRGCRRIITYTVAWNPKSINSLIACGFRFYEPQNAWGGREMLYWYHGEGRLA